MDRVIVACVQQQMRVYETHEDYRTEIRRFMHVAASKGARLVVFPELAGVMAAPPLISGLKLGLLRAADPTRRPSVLSRMVGRVANSAGALLGGFGGALLELLTRHNDDLKNAYFDIFGRAAREFDIYVVGGSLYLFNESGDAIRNVSYVFGPYGQILGYQEKINLYVEDETLCTPGESFQLFTADFGRFGLLIGTEALYPESARVLTFQGAEILINIAACPGPILFHKVRAGIQARVQENQVFGLQSCLVGNNSLAQTFKDDYMGRSSLLAPVELTPRHSGVLAEVGTTNAEGIVVSTWDFALLRELWEASDIRPRRDMNVGVYRRHLPGIYAMGRTIDELYLFSLNEPPLKPTPPAEDSS
jgi:predicted amidohydrolase